MTTALFIFIILVTWLPDLKIEFNGGVPVGSWLLRFSLPLGQLVVTAVAIGWYLS